MAYTADVTGKLTYESHTSGGAIAQYKVLANDASDRSKIFITIKDGKNTVETDNGAVASDTTLNGKNGSATVITKSQWNVTVQSDGSGSLSATLNIDMGGNNKWDQDISGTLTLGGTYPIEGTATEGS